MLQCSHLILRQGDFSLHCDFEVPEGTMLTLLGKSGAGKSTILHCIAGFRTPDSGDILYKKKSLLSLPANKRNIRLVFQDYALFTHMSVYQNIAYGLHIKHYPKHTIEKEVHSIMRILHIYKYKNASVDTLSGGEQQRVALARAIISKPDILLFDEPLGALDNSLREECRKEIRTIQQKNKLTSIYVTHDQEEAFAISDTIAIINEGRIEQIGTPKNLYNNPKNIFVATFLGECNILHGTIIDIQNTTNNKAQNKTLIIQTNIGMIKTTNPHPKAYTPSDKITLYIRPEHIQLNTPTTNPTTENTHKATIIQEEFRGSYNRITLRIHTETMIMNIPSHIDITNKEQTVFLTNIQTTIRN